MKIPTRPSFVDGGAEIFIVVQVPLNDNNNGGGNALLAAFPAQGATP